MDLYNILLVHFGSFANTVADVLLVLAVKDLAELFIIYGMG